MYTDLLNILLLIGAVQGFLFTIITFFSKRLKSKSNYFLALLILGFSLNNFQYYFSLANLISYDTLINYIFLPYASVNMVFYYFYVKTYLNPEFVVGKKEKMLFVPFLFFFIVVTLYKILYGFDLLSEKMMYSFYTMLFYHEIFSLIFSLILLLLVVKTIRRYKSRLHKEGDNQLNRSPDWLMVLSFIGLMLCIFWLVGLVSEFWGWGNEYHFYYTLWIGMSFAIYILGHIGLYKFGLIEEQKELKSKSKFKTTKAKSKPFKTENENLDKFRNFVMVERNFMDSNLSLEMVASYLNLNKSYLSRIINAEMGTNYSDYVNSLRVEEAKKYLDDPDYNNFTLHAIGLEVGFNSKSSFNSAFKKFTGLTPTEYKKKMLSEADAFNNK